MKLNGMLILVLAVALAAFTGVAWTEGGDKSVCPLTGENPACTGHGPHGHQGDPACTGHGPHGHQGDPACTGHGPGPHGLMGSHHQPDRMAAALDLTDEQREAMREIMSAGRAATGERMETALAGILTAEQFVQLEEIKARHETRGGKARTGQKGRMGHRGQMSGDPGDRAARRLEQMTEHLDLTPDQQDQIRQILADVTPPPRSETREMIRAVLTPEQQEKMGQQRPENHPGMGQGPGHGMGRNPHARGSADLEMGFPHHLVRQLQLTDEQSEAVRQLMTEIRSEQRSQTRSQIEALLTPEQRDKMDQLHQN